MEQAIQDCKIVVSLNASAKIRGIIVLYTLMNGTQIRISIRGF